MSWQTLNTRSALAHVLMPEAFQLFLGIFEHAECKHLRECLIGRPAVEETADVTNDHLGTEEVHSRPRLIDAVYTELDVTWRGLNVTVRTTNLDGELCVLIEPNLATLPLVPPLLTLEAAILWNRLGMVERRSDHLVFRRDSREVPVYATAPFSGQIVHSLNGVHATLLLDGPVGVSTGRALNLAQIREKLAAGRARRDATLAAFGAGEPGELAGAVHSALGWTQVFDPGSQMAITVVSRVWSSRNGGSLVGCWDSLFEAMMAAAVGDKALATANLEAITRPIDALGYIPNCLNAVGSATFGQSQPPVGSMAARYVQRATGDAALAQTYLDRLLTWNRWWPQHRERDGYLCWGSRREPFRIGGLYEKLTGTLQAARFESGLDNAPMFDDTVFDEEHGLMLQADVGLMSLYVRDCLDLAVLCEEAGRDDDARELRQRAEKYLGSLETLWDDEHGIYLNRDLARGVNLSRLSPCNFYPLLTGRTDPARVERMIREHLLNEDEFWGEFVLPSISRDDPAYPDQSYWRGRVWAPMNLLVYWGLVTVGQHGVARELAAKGNALFLKNWRERGFIGENYHAETGLTGERANSDPFNPWGALLGLVGLVDAGSVAPLESAATGGKTRLDDAVGVVRTPSVLVPSLAA